jgi:ankyrin repeat protein
MRGASGNSAENEGHFESMAALLGHGIDPNVHRFGQTALHFLAARANLNEDDRARFAGLLLDHGARVDVRDELLKSTPLGWASRWGRVSLARVLIERGAAVEERDAEAWASPMAWAGKMKRDGIVGMLIQHQ